MVAEVIDLSIVCPFYNEEEMVRLFMEKLVPLLKDTEKSFEIICVNDGSVDNTLNKLLESKNQFDFAYFSFPNQRAPIVNFWLLVCFSASR